MILTFFSKKTNLPIFFFILTTTLFSQSLPPSNCSPSGGITADLIDVQTKYRAPGGPAATFLIPIGTQNATLTISSHQGVIGSPSAQQLANDEDFISATVDLDFESNTSSGILNFAQSTFTDESESNLYTWIDVPFGTNVASQVKEGQITSPPLNDLTISLNFGVLTVTETNPDIHSSYVIEFTSPLSSSMNFSAAGALFFTGGSTDITQSFAYPSNTDVIIITKKGTVRNNVGGFTSGWEEGYADGRIVVDVQNGVTNGFLTTANGSDLAARSTYVMQDHPATSTTAFTSSGNAVGDFSSKNTTNPTTIQTGLSDPAIYVSGGQLFVTRNASVAEAFDDIFFLEFYERNPASMSASFITSRSSFIARGDGTFAGTDKDISIPTGSDYALIRQAGNANNLAEEANENPLAGYYIIDLNNELASGYLWQQVGFASGGRRDDNYGFSSIPLNGTSTRINGPPPAISDGIYYPNSNVYDVRFTLSADKTTLTVTNAFGEVPTEYKSLLLATFYGKKTDLTATTTIDPSTYNAVNDGTCGGVDITLTVCNPGSGNSAGGFPFAVYSQDPTQTGTALLVFTGNFPDPISQGSCVTDNFNVNFAPTGLNDYNGTYYIVLNDDGREAPGGIGTSIGQPFDLEDLEGQNEDYIECDYTNNLIPFTVSGVMTCPTVDFLVTNSTDPTMTGTYDNTNSTGLSVTENGTTYVLGVNGQLTTPSAGVWSLDLTSTGLTSPNIYSLEATSTNASGSAEDGTSDELIITEAGLILLDVNGQTDNSINGSAIDQIDGNPLYVNIIDVTSGNVVETSPVQASGTYVVTSGSFTNGNDYSFQLSIIQGVIGNAAPAVQLSGDYVYTAEGETPTGDGAPNGIYTTTIADNTDLPAVSFGIQEKPTAGGVTIPGIVDNNIVQGTRYNPGVFGGFELPGQALGGTDDGNISEVTLTSISSTNNNILYVTYFGIDYYRDPADKPVGCLLCGDFPAGGITIPTNSNGTLRRPLFLATVDGFLDGSLFLDYQVTDNAGFISDNTSILEVPVVALKYTTGGGWENGSDPSGQPNQDDGDKTLFWIDDGGTLNVNATVNNAIIYNGVNAEVDGVCFKVNNEMDNRGGRLVLRATSDQEYGQYYGPSVEALMEMQIEGGWHNIGFPVDITVGDLATQNNTVAEPDKVRITGDIANSNLMSYDTKTSGGEEYGFFVSRNNASYAAHAYGQYVPSDNADNLIDKGWNYYLDEAFANSLPTILSAEGMTNDASKDFDTHNNFGGWNLIPNIYPVALSTQSMFDDGFFSSDFDKAIFIWNPNDDYVAPIPGNTNQGAYIGFDPENGVSINGALSSSAAGDALVAPFQSFYIRRTDASEERRVNVDGTNIGGLATQPAIAVGDPDPLVTPTVQTVSMKPSYRSSCSITAHYKTTTPKADIVLLEVKDEENGFIDGLELAFAGHYTNAFDSSYDIRKFAAGDEQFPVLFSVLYGEAYVINKRAIPYQTESVPVGFSSSLKERRFSISAKMNSAYYNLLLEDKLTGNWHDLNKGPYTFTNDSQFQIERFRLHFNNGRREVALQPEVHVWSGQEGLNIEFERFPSGFAEIMVTDIMGNLIYQEDRVNTNTLKTIPDNKLSAANLIIVTVRSNQIVRSVKVFR